MAFAWTRLVVGGLLSSGGETQPLLVRGLNRIFCFVMVLMGVVPAARAVDEPFKAGVPTRAATWDRDPYTISIFEILYANDQVKGLPSLADLKGISIDLGLVNGEYVVSPKLEQKFRQQNPEDKVDLAVPYRPRVIPTESRRFADLSAGQPRVYHFSALWAIDEQVRVYMNTRRNVIGVYIAPDPEQIDPGTFKDARSAGKTNLTLIVQTGVVTEVRTVASGQRVRSDDKRINNPVHAAIRANSPVKAGSSPTTNQSVGGVALRRDLLDDYIFRLNRHPGRHVDVAISAASEKEPGQVVLDYLVSETKPWSVYVQGSNTGTKQTSEWRERFGFVTDQATNHDDILSIDYTTAGFTTSHNVNISYESPFSTAGRLRYKVYGTYNQFTASDVGFSKESFSGEEYLGGGELAYNLLQRRDAFLDAVGGVRYEHIRVNNAKLSSAGSAAFLVPYLGLRFDKNAEIFSIQANITLQGRFTGSSQDTLNRLGRLNTNATAYMVQADATQTAFLEPLFDRRAFDEARGTLAHEVSLSVRAQYTFGNDRMIPQGEEVAGGFYSVRGYPESVVAGDTVVIGSAEYRFHIPRSFAPKEVPQKTPLNRLFGQNFRVVPPVTYGRPDWDVILRAFFDAGRTINNNAAGFEKDQTLIGTGVGFELQYRQNLNIRLDFGIPLVGVDRLVTAGSNRIHISATILY